MPTARSSPPVVQLAALLNAANAVHGETETVQDLRFLLGQGSPLGGARPKSAVALPDGQLAIAKFPKPDDVRDIAAGEILALTLDQERLRTARRREGRYLWRRNLTDPDPAKLWQRYLHTYPSRASLQRSRRGKISAPLWGRPSPQSAARRLGFPRTANAEAREERRSG